MKSARAAAAGLDGAAGALQLGAALFMFGGGGGADGAAGGVLGPVDVVEWLLLEDDVCVLEVVCEVESICVAPGTVVCVVDDVVLVVV